MRMLLNRERSAIPTSLDNEIFFSVPSTINKIPNKKRQETSTIVTISNIDLSFFIVHSAFRQKIFKKYPKKENNFYKYVK